MRQMTIRKIILKCEEVEIIGMSVTHGFRRITKNNECWNIEYKWDCAEIGGRGARNLWCKKTVYRLQMGLIWDSKRGNKLEPMGKHRHTHCMLDSHRSMYSYSGMFLLQDPLKSNSHRIRTSLLWRHRQLKTKPSHRLVHQG